MNKLKNLSLKMKIFSIVGILLALNIFITAYSISKLAKLKEVSNQITNVTYKQISLLNKLGLAHTKLAVRLRDLIINQNLDERKKIVVQIKENHAKITSLIEDFQKIGDPEDLNYIEKYATNISYWYTLFETGSQFILEGHDKDAIKIFTQDMAGIRKEMEENLSTTISINEKSMETDILTADSQYKNDRLILISIAILSLLSLTLLTAIIVQNITKTLNAIIESIRTGSHVSASSSTQIASASHELSQASTEQAASLEQTAASLEQIAAAINKTNENANLAANVSEESQKKAEHGKDTVDRMVISIEEISSSNESIISEITESNAKLVEIVNVIQEIGNKTKVIHDIVFQTKLLSFNASVEAARAGEHGKGFAVVAEEVGNLAAMSGNAAKEISEMLNSSIPKVESIVKESKEKVERIIGHAKEKVDSGVEVARECSDILNEIVSNVTEVSNLAKEISVASNEQSKGVSEINKAIAQLDSVTHQNTSATEQIATTAEELSNQAHKLETAVGDLVFTVKGESSQTNLEYSPSVA